MLIIVLSILLGFLLFGLATIIGSKLTALAISGFITIILFAGVIVGLFAPVSGFTEWKLLEETELISLSNSTVGGSSGVVYVSLTAGNAYTYRHEINSKFGTDSSVEYTTVTLVNKDVEEIEDVNCQKPVIRIYTCQGKKSIWTFALGSKQTKYVFYVPEGTITKEIKLE